MALRITTWNVNGIRNPFGYQPWRDKRTFEGMFDILEADIIVFQETKIQRKDLRDDMVLVPGFDCYWSLPKHKKGYSGVVIYTRNSKCAPIRAEEGITGVLSPPNSTLGFRDLPEEEQIGGYPTLEQLSQSEIDPATLDSEGRCVILEFPGLVVIGTYCPAERDETRTHFRTAFLTVLDSRIRNLVKMGKRVIWTGDLNITRQQIDTAMADEMMRRNNVDSIGWISTPARRLFNQILVDGIVHGERDEGRETGCMWDICRAFHPARVGMYTCWETKVNARPGNFGARIDYVLCSQDMKDWFCDSNIQEGLHGSDHCPVYAVFKDYVDAKGEQKHILDIVNPSGMFEGGVRQQPWTNQNLLCMSGKLITEFDKRQNIRDMFTRKPSMPKGQSIEMATTPDISSTASAVSPPSYPPDVSSPGHRRSQLQSDKPAGSPTKPVAGKRTKSEPPGPAKRGKSSASNDSKGQQSLKGFFKTKDLSVPKVENPNTDFDAPLTDTSTETPTSFNTTDTSADASVENVPPSPVVSQRSVPENEASTFAAKQTWGKLFAKPIAPKCEHSEPCKTMLTKKPGINCGRSFWMCNRPLGPSGQKEKGTQWRCSTFIWCSDWDTRTDAG